jgi:hypothetical protein
MSVRWVASAALALARHPELWAAAVRQIGVLSVAGWWRRAPFLPLPDAAYLRFRFQTMYGDPDHAPDPEDVITYLRWCRAWPRVTA